MNNNKTNLLNNNNQKNSFEFCAKQMKVPAAKSSKSPTNLKMALNDN